MILKFRFGEGSADKMVNWVEKNFEDKEKSILDLGTGNGHLLFQLVDFLFDYFLFCCFFKKKKNE